MVRESPVFLGAPKVELQTFSSGVGATKDVFSSDVSNSQAITQLVYFQDSAVASTLTIQATDGVTTARLAKFTTPATANLSINLLSSEYIPGMDDISPILLLEPGMKLQVIKSNSATDADIYAAGGAFA